MSTDPVTNGMWALLIGNALVAVAGLILGWRVRGLVLFGLWLQGVVIVLLGIPLLAVALDSRAGSESRLFTVPFGIVEAVFIVQFLVLLAVLHWRARRKGVPGRSDGGAMAPAEEVQAGDGAGRHG